MKLTKSIIESYKLRFDDHFYWADINIDALDKSGRIQIASDYGDWQYYFGSCSINFKEFLINLNIDYLANKFGENKWFDLDKTIDNLNNRINEIDLLYNKIEIEYELNNLKNSSCKEEFINTMWQCPKILKMEDYCPHLITDISPAFKNFWKNIWIPFINELKKELNISNN